MYILTPFPRTEQAIRPCHFNVPLQVMWVQLAAAVCTNACKVMNMIQAFKITSRWINVGTNHEHYVQFFSSTLKRLSKCACPYRLTDCSGVRRRTVGLWWKVPNTVSAYLKGPAGESATALTTVEPSSISALHSNEYTCLGSKRLRYNSAPSWQQTGGTFHRAPSKAVHPNCWAHSSPHSPLG